MNALLNKDRTSEVIDAEYELLRAMYEAGVWDFLVPLKKQNHSFASMWI